MITSGGLGTMGYGLPAAIGAKVAKPDCLVVGMIISRSPYATSLIISRYRWRCVLFDDTHGALNGCTVQHWRKNSCVK